MMGASLSGSRPLLVAGATALTFAVIAMTVAFFPLLADDAYIVARYVEQWYRGHGLLYNPGERINVLTSPLHLFVLAAIRGLTLDPVTAYRMLAGALVAVTLTVVAWRRWGLRVNALLFLVLTLASPFIVFWMSGGLETPLLLSVCTAIAYLALRSDPPDDRRTAGWIIALSGLAVMTRYDAVLFVGPLALVCAWRYRNDAKIVTIASIAVFAIIGWLGFTFFYYGDLLPTSFYVKAADQPTASEIARGLGYLASFAVLSFLWVAALVGRRHLYTQVWTPLALALVVGLLAELAYGVFAGIKHMMYSYRLFVPYLPALVLLLLPPPDNAGGNPQPSVFRFGLVATCLVFQGTLAFFMYYYSENPNLTLLFRPRSAEGEVYEFSMLGARHTETFLRAVRAQARPIEAHWATTPNAGIRPPRIVVDTGGTLPYLLPEAYTLEILASYRHRCKPDLATMADFHQLVFREDLGNATRSERVRRGLQLIHHQSIVVDGLLEAPLSLAVEIWYQPAPAPLALPPMINLPCIGRSFGRNR